MKNVIEFGDCRATLQRWAQQGVQAHTCVTSPPYYGLRDYGTATWHGGDPACDHLTNRQRGTDMVGTLQATAKASRPHLAKTCDRCGAVREDLQIGGEQSPEEYVNNMVDVFRGVRDVLRDDGTLFLNLGDSYYNYRPGRGQALVKQSHSATDQDLPQACARRGNKLEGLKEKDLIGIPWRVAFALQADGWYLRQDIIWNKPNPQPESVKDRCTKSHEYIFLLSKSSKYYFDYEAIREPIAAATAARMRRGVSAQHKNVDGAPGQTAHTHGQPRENDPERDVPEERNKRSVWNVAVASYTGAHFAVFPPELITPCVIAGAPAGGTVLDPFMGSGTTAFVAQEHGRYYLGCELNNEYKALQDARLRQQCLMLGA